VAGGPRLDAVENDVTLVERARTGDEAALLTLVERYAPRVLRFGRKLCGDDQDAQDVVQQTLLTAVSKIREFRGESQFSTWLFSIARSHCIKHRTRGGAMLAPQPLDERSAAIAAPVDSSPDEQLGKQQLQGALDSAIAALEPAQREVLVLRDVEGLSAAEVAQALDLSVDAVKSRLHRARKNLRERLEPWFEQSTPGPACPDVVELLSRYQEGDVTSEACKIMEAHVDGCPECAKRCHALRSVLSACSALPEPQLPDALRQGVAAQIRHALLRQTGASS
jgi:RNA polymerase sigma-70 factor (ECF subfamily)